MKNVFIFLLCIVSPLFADTAKFASQTDLVGDLSDALLNGIYRYHPGYGQCCFDPCGSEPNFWLQGFGSYRNRDQKSTRGCYDEWFGGILGGVGTSLSSNRHLNFFVGGSWGEIEIDQESSNIDTDSILFGMTFEQMCDSHFIGFAFASGILTEKRHFKGIKEEPQGIFLSPELTYSSCFHCFCAPSVVTATLRYAGFFSRDYQAREILGTLYVKERCIQLLTLRGELIPFLFDKRCFYLAPYLGLAGRFQVDGNEVKGHLILDDIHLSDNLDCSIGYGFVGIRSSRQCGCLCLQLNLEGSYDTDKSGRLLGEFSVNYIY